MTINKTANKVFLNELLGKHSPPFSQKNYPNIATIRIHMELTHKTKLEDDSRHFSSAGYAYLDIICIAKV